MGQRREGGSLWAAGPRGGDMKKQASWVED